MVRTEWQGNHFLAHAIWNLPLGHQGWTVNKVRRMDTETHNAEVCTWTLTYPAEARGSIQFTREGNSWGKRMGFVPRTSCGHLWAKCHCEDSTQSSGTRKGGATLRIGRLLSPAAMQNLDGEGLWALPWRPPLSGLKCRLSCRDDGGARLRERFCLFLNPTFALETFPESYGG